MMTAETTVKVSCTHHESQPIRHNARAAGAKSSCTAADVGGEVVGFVDEDLPRRLR